MVPAAPGAAPLQALCGVEATAAQRMVRDLMTGAKPLWSDKAWLYDIVANKTNGIDVDKMDYLKRDAYHTKMSLSLDVQRLMLKSKVHKHQVGDPRAAGRGAQLLCYSRGA
jgi:HD superfamily phosphohydrolase